MKLRATKKPCPKCQAEADSVEILETGELKGWQCKSCGHHEELSLE